MCERRNVTEKLNIAKLNIAKLNIAKLNIEGIIQPA